MANINTPGANVETGNEKLQDFKGLVDHCKNQYSEKGNEIASNELDRILEAYEALKNDINGEAKKELNKLINDLGTEGVDITKFKLEEKSATIAINNGGSAINETKKAAKIIATPNSIVSVDNSGVSQAEKVEVSRDKIIADLVSKDHNLIIENGKVYVTVLCADGKKHRGFFTIATNPDIKDATSLADWKKSRVDALDRKYGKVANRDLKNTETVKTFFAKTEVKPTVVANASTKSNETFSKDEDKTSTTVEGKEVVAEKTNEDIFNARIEKALNPETHIFLELEDGKVFVMEGGEKEREAFLRLEDSLDDKYAAYAMLKMISLNKGSITTVSEAFKDASKGLGATQAVLSEGSSRDKVLLDSAMPTDVNVIEVDKGSTLGNVLANTFTLGLADIDTANVTNETIENDSEGKKLSSERLYNGYSETVEYANGNSHKEIKVRALNENSAERYIGNLADKIEDILDDGKITSKELETSEGKIALKFLASPSINMIDSADLARLEGGEKITVRLKSHETEEVNDDMISDWLDDNNDAFMPKNAGIEISKDGFIQFDLDVLKSDDSVVKINLEGNGEDFESKEVLMSKTLVPFSKLGIEGDLSKLPDTIEPIVFEQDGLMMQITSDGIYVIGEGIGNGVDAVADYIEEHDVVTAAILGGIIGAILVGRIDISLAIPSINLPSINIPSIDIPSLDLSGPLGAAGATYFLTMIPMQYKVEGLEHQLAKISANYEGGKSLDAELAALNGEKVDYKYLNNSIEKQNSEGKNEEMHKALVSSGLFNVGEITGMDLSNVNQTVTGYNITVNGNGEAVDSRINLNGKEFYVAEGDKLTFNLVKSTGKVEIVSGTISIPVSGKDNKLEITDGVVTLVETKIMNSDIKTEVSESPIDYLRNINKEEAAEEPIAVEVTEEPIAVEVVEEVEAPIVNEVNAASISEIKDMISDEGEYNTITIGTYQPKGGGEAKNIIIKGGNGQTPVIELDGSGTFSDIDIKIKPETLERIKEGGDTASIEQAIKLQMRALTRTYNTLD